MSSGWGEAAEQARVVDKVDGTFEDLEEASRERGLKLGIYGRECVGKTFFALTAPAPVYVIDTEMGTPPLRKQFPNKVIKYKQIFEPDAETLERDDSKSFETIKAAIDTIYRNPAPGGTVVVDSVTDMWAMCQAYCKVHVFKITPSERLHTQWDWGVINSAYQQLLMKLLALPMHVILTARASEEYLGAGQPTGKWDASWQKKTPFWLDVTMHNEKTIVKGAPIFKSTIDKSRPFPKLIGKTYENLTFDKLMKDIEPYW